MTRKEQYIRDLSRAAKILEYDAEIERELVGRTRAASNRVALAARLRNYGCLNPFREPDKKVRKGK